MKISAVVFAQRKGFAFCVGNQGTSSRSLKEQKVKLLTTARNIGSSPHNAKPNVICSQNQIV